MSAGTSRSGSVRGRSARYGCGTPRQQDTLPPVPGALPATLPAEQPIPLPIGISEHRRRRQELARALNSEAQLCGLSAREAVENKKNEADVQQEDNDDASVESRDPDAPRTACRPIWSAHKRHRVPPLAATNAPSAANYLVPDVVIGDDLDPASGAYEMELLEPETADAPLEPAPPALQRAAAPGTLKAPRRRNMKPIVLHAAGAQPAQTAPPPAAHP